MKSTVVPTTSPFLPDILAFPGGLDSKESAWKKKKKESAWNAGDLGSTSGLGRSPGGGNEPTPVFLTGEFHGQRRLAGYSPRGLKESDMPERLTPTGHPRLEIKILNYCTLYRIVEQCSQNPVTCRGYLGYMAKYPRHVS